MNYPLMPRCHSEISWEQMSHFYKVKAALPILTSR